MTVFFFARFSIGVRRLYPLRTKRVTLPCFLSFQGGSNRTFPGIPFLQTQWTLPLDEREQATGCRLLPDARRSSLFIKKSGVQFLPNREALQRYISLFPPCPKSSFSFFRPEAKEISFLTGGGAEAAFLDFLLFFSSPFSTRTTCVEVRFPSSPSTGKGEGSFPTPSSYPGPFPFGVGVRPLPLFPLPEKKGILNYCFPLFFAGSDN